MKTKQYKLSCLKEKVKKERHKRARLVKWILTEQEKEYIENVLGLRVEAYLFKIQTRTFKNLYKINHSILKDLHYAHKRGKKYLIKNLTEKEKAVLKEYGINYPAYQYKVYLY